MKSLKKSLSLVLLLALLVGMFSLSFNAKAADESDVVQGRRWSTPDSNNYGYVYEVVLNPKYVKSGNIRITATYYDGDKNLIEQIFTDYSLNQRDVEGFGLCHVITVAAYNKAVYLQPNSFYDKDGNGNKKIYLTNSQYDTDRCIVNMEPSLRPMKYVVEQGTCTKITFDEKGYITFGGKMLAENVHEYTLEHSDLGEQELTLSFNGLTIWSHNIIVKTAKQIRKDKIAELKKELSDATKAFFECLPIAFVTLPLAPLAIFGFLWPFAPIEIGGHIFDILSEIWHLRLQR